MATRSTDNPDLLDAWLRPLLRAIGPAERRRLLLDLVRDLRAANQHRIRNQQNPDGSPYESRRPRDEPRGPMFTGLRKAKYFTAAATPNEATTGYRGRLAELAAVHQQGLAERLGPRGPVHRYAQRRLIGIAPADRAAVLDRVLRYLGGDG